MAETKIEIWKRKIKNAQRREDERRKAHYNAQKAETWRRISTMPEVEPQIVKYTVNGTSRKLAAGWTFEVNQDLETAYSLDLVKKIKKEILSGNHNSWKKN